MPGAKLINGGLNKQHPNGSWSLHSDYLQYRNEGGEMSPEAWNARVKQLAKEAKIDRVDHYKQTHPVNSCPICGLFNYACKCPSSMRVKEVVEAEQ